MGDANRKPGGPPLVVEYGQRPPPWRPDATPERERRVLLGKVAVAAAVTLAYWFGLFWTCRPALNLFCVGPFVPFLLACFWSLLGWQLLALGRHDPPSRPLAWRAVTAAALFLAPYSLLRAHNDMFSLGVRYRLLCAGGAEKVQAELSQWVASRPAIGPNDERQVLFWNRQPGGVLVPVPPSQLPPRVQYMRQHIGSGFGTTRRGAAVLGGVAFPNTADVMIGPPGWQPRDRATVFDHVCGSHRKLADGVWIRVGVYDK